MFTNNDYDMFSCGCCHVLAYAIQEISGWPVCAFWERGWYDTHAFVRTPRDTYIDIAGEHAEDALLRTWRTYKIVEVDADDNLRDVWEGHTIEWPDAQTRARQLAPIIVDDIKRGQVTWTR